MASRRSRRGSFGLQPRVAPNVTNTIVALSREYVAKRDALIMDAWRNGGQFEGKKATDDMVLAYWKERGKGLDKNDPDYEQAQNQVMQLTYAVEQSKADLKHVQGKLSDEAYAQFFLRWAKKVPANSEFYRTLQKDAAQLIESAKRRGAANAQKAKTDAFNAFVKTTQAQKIAIGDALTGALTDLSKATGMSITGNGAELLDLLSTNVKNNPTQYRALLDAIHAGDPGWNGQITPDYFSKHIKDASDGYSLIADRAQKAGFVSAYASAAKGEADMSSWGQNLKVWPVATSYTTSENAFLRVWNDPNASQPEKLAAARQFSAQIDGWLQNDKGMDAATRAMLTADSKRLLGEDGGDAPSFGTAMLGRSGVSPEDAMKIGAYTQLEDSYNKQYGAWAYAPVDKNGQLDPTGQGPLGIVPMGAVGSGAQAVVVPGRDGKAVLAYIQPHTVYAEDPNNPNGTPKAAGLQLTYNVGGQQVTMWGYNDASNHPRWSLQSPLQPGATVRTDNKGDVYVTAPPTAADPIARANQLDPSGQLAAQISASGAQGGTASASQSFVDTSVKGQKTTTKLSYANGVFTLTKTVDSLDDKGHVTGSTTTPMDIATNTPGGMAFSQSALTAGNIPGITFTSPIQASVQAAQSTQTVDQVSRFAGDPIFQQQFVQQTMNTLGITNPYDPRIAAAWKSVTTPTRVLPTDYPSEAARAAARVDLNYPGVKDIPDVLKPSISFGPQGELRLPGMPSYLQPQVYGPPTTLPGAQSPLSGLGTFAIPPQTYGPPATPPPSITQTTTPTVTPTAPITPVSPTSAPPVTTVSPTTSAPSAPTTSYNQKTHYGGY